jgi:pimeloyl-ACP methyl ester carboxylesterase
MRALAAPARSTVPSQDGTTIAFDSFGAGQGLIVIGGCLSTGRDYAPFARALARSFAVHVIERRGRGASGRQGPDYGIDKEVEDLFAVQAATGASAVFGHSYGGLIALEGARHSGVFSQVVVYEPGVSVRGSIPLAWIPHYRELLAAGDRRGAFASMVRQHGFAPLQLGRLPLPLVRLILRLVVRRKRWQELCPLLEANLAEHEQVARLDDGTLDRYSSISARVLLLGGQKSPRFITTDLFAALQGTILNADAHIIDGLDHLAPEESPDLVAELVRRYLRHGVQPAVARAPDRVRGDPAL